MRNNFTMKFLVVGIILLISSSMYGQVTLHGIVTDSLTQEPLIGASVVLLGTSQGAATNFDGEYKIPNITDGNYRVRISYVGYQTKTLELPLKGNKTVELFVQLSTGKIEGKTIEVTAQAQGQLSAINEQLASNKIVNVVSADKMKELPDANIAESIGRLPGISLARNAGEAYAVVIRGLSAKYNEVSIEGIPMSSTNYYDRTVDLSLLSDDLIKGVEVSKTLRPDMDANALGGTVNLTLKSAPSGLHYDIKGNGGYNKLRNTYANYKFAGSVSNRFFDDVLGLQVQGNIEEKQLPSDQFNAGYSSPVYDSKTNQFSITTSSAQLTETSLKRHRYGLSAMLDYTSELVDIKFFNVFDMKVDSNITRTYQSNFSSNSILDQIYISETKTEQRTHSLQANFKLWGTELPVAISYTKGSQDAPNSQQFDLLQSGLKAIPTSAKIYAEPSNLMQLQGLLDPNQTTVWNFFDTNPKLTDESYDLKIDWKIPFKLSDSFSGILSAGGKYHQTTRTSENSRVYYNVQWGGSKGRRVNLINAFPFLHGVNEDLEGGIPAAPFVDPNYTRTSILGYPIGPGWNVQRLSYVMNTIYPAWLNVFYDDGVGDFSQDYNDKEKSYAGYIMGEFNIGTDLTIVPGIRYQEEKTDISAYHIRVNGSNQNGLDGVPPKLVQTTRDNPFWYPSVNIKYKAGENIQVLGAVYKSVSLPSYAEISPLVILNDYGVQISNPMLKPATAWNFDLGASLFSNDIGLFSVNLFYKEITNLVYYLPNYYPYSPYVVLNAPSDIADRLPNKSYFDTTWAVSQSRRLSSTYIPMNDPSKAYLRGIELSWQTHLWYLPGLLSGIVLDLNLSLMSSNQLYPSFAFQPKKSILAKDTLVYTTTAGSLQDQPSAIYNAIIGWDYKGFSSRFSFRYQQKTLTSMDTRFGLQNSYYDNVLLVDISLKQKIIDNLSVFANATNINNHIDNYYFSHPTYVTSTGTTYPAGKLPTSGQTYSWALQFGISYGY